METKKIPYCTPVNRVLQAINAENFCASNVGPVNYREGDWGEED